MTEDQMREKMLAFAKERQAKLVAALLKKIDSFVISDLATFKKVIEEDVAEKVSILLNDSFECFFWMILLNDSFERFGS